MKNTAHAITDVPQKLPNRDVTIDILKGIGILAVIVGHLTSFGQQFIFSFHMPLFFILSGYLFSTKPFRTSVKSDFKRLILPYCFTAIIIIAAYSIVSIVLGKWVVLRWIAAAIWGSGAPHNAPIMGGFPAIGAIWFLFALFWCRNIFLFLTYKISSIAWLGVYCALISISATIIDNFIISLPLAFLPGCGAIIFYYAGYVLRSIDGFHQVGFKMSAFLIVIWIVAVCIPNRPLAMVICDYPFYPLTVIGGIAGTIILYCFSYKLLSINAINKLRGGVAWIGECSLVILCLHLIDLDIPFRKVLGIQSAIPTIIFDITFCVIGTMILSQFSFVRDIFKIKKVNILRKN